MIIKKLSLSLFLICVGCAPTAVPSVTSPSTPPAPSISPSVQPSGSPEPSRSPEPSPQPSSLPTPTPFPTPIVSGTPVFPIPTPTVPLPTPIPEFSPTTLLPMPPYLGDCSHTYGDDIAITESTLMTGKVVDEDNNPVVGAHIRLKSLEPCVTYGAETATNAKGEYELPRQPPNIPVEIEVSVPFQPSAFYQTRLKSNKQVDPHTNYFPFQVKTLPAQDCIALAPSLVNISGTVSIENPETPPASEALVHLKSLDSCSRFDTMAPTTKQVYLLSVRSLGSPGQLAVSFAGQPTAVFEVPVNSNKQQLPNVNVHDVTFASPSAWPELNPVWTPGTLYAGTQPLE